ncbi:SMC-Scp complex subunit ScpB [Pseudonocardia nematodicida]|uniref:SMC-Scp complex subunit ScpB n=1 Tax=Pseudonocardia nematodicida TaxID=1206997 RepID=A0ABV1K6A7_9PSEU
MVTEPDDRPGSDDPEDPSELLRLIGRTVPRSPHAGAFRATVPVERPADDTEPAAAVEPADDPEPVEAAEPAAEATPAEYTGPVDTDVTPGGAAGGPGQIDRERGPDGGATAGPGEDDAAGIPRVDEPGGDDPAGAEDESGEMPGLAEEPPVTGDELADDTDLEHALEALLLVVDSPVDETSLATALNQPAARIRATLHRMSLALTADARGIDLRRAGEGWRFYTRDRYAPYVEKMLLDGQRARLTRAALETLAVVAYRQPVTRARVAAVRGVNCDGVLKTLWTRGLVEEAGTEETTGGTLFRTTELFLERLGLSSVQELPPLAPLLPDIDAIDDLDGN